MSLILGGTFENIYEHLAALEYLIGRVGLDRFRVQDLMVYSVYLAPGWSVFLAQVLETPET